MSHISPGSTCYIELYRACFGGAATGANAFWLGGGGPTATIKKAAPFSRSVLINSASDVFLCVYLTSEKELEDKRFPPERKQRIYHANKTRINRAAECHYTLQAPGHRIRCRPKDFVSTNSRDRKPSVLYSARTDPPHLLFRV